MTSEGICPGSRWASLVAARWPEARWLERYDGVPVAALLPGRQAPLLVASALPSTQDAAHHLAAAGAPSGTIVVAERQTAGRGRQGRSWESAAASGVWLTWIDRPRDAGALGVLSLRLGLRIAAALEPLAATRPLVKWPNDVHVADGKVAGILVEARWRDERPEWVAIGVGVNVRVPDDAPPGAAGLRADIGRAAVLRALVPAIAGAREGGAVLAPDELAAWEARDLAVGRRCVAPARGAVLGITADGLLRVRDDDGEERRIRAGSLRLADHPTSGDDACCS